MPGLQPGSSESATHPRRSDKPIRLLLADDHVILLESLRRLLASEPDFELVGAATTTAATVQLARTLNPDVLLLDVAMPDVSGLDALDELEDITSLHVLLLTAGIDDEQRSRAFRAGARGIVLKDAGSEVLIAGIRAVARGDYWMWRKSSVTRPIEAALRPFAPRPAYTLTSRERTVLKALVDGCTNREIAERLGISEDTVKHHVTSLFDKTGASTRVELALFALHHKMVS